MRKRTGTSGDSSRAKRTLILTAAVSLLSAAPMPRQALAASVPNFAVILPEFNRICAELGRAREDLRVGLLDEDEFADRILALFVDADSLRAALGSSDLGSRRYGGTAFAMERGLRCLIDSLRENYVGIVARNGASFIVADRALQAAVAWRSGVGSADGAGGVAAAARD